MLTLLLAHAALNWADLNKSEPVDLATDVAMSESLVLKKGTRFEFREAMPLDHIPVTVLELQAQDCPFPEAEAEMVLIDPRHESERDSLDRSVGVMLYKNCLVEVYVETRDYPTKSFFVGANAEAL